MFMHAFCFCRFVLYIQYYVQLLAQANTRRTRVHTRSVIWAIIRSPKPSLRHFLVNFYGLRD